MSARYYHTQAWRQLRRRCLERDGYRCHVEGCATPASIADHIVPRSQGGEDAIANLRSVCPDHDNQGHRERRRGGARDERFTVKGCSTDGMPVDPNHWWNDK